MLLEDSFFIWNIKQLFEWEQTRVQQLKSLVKLLPLSVPGTRDGVANSVALGWLPVTSQSYSRQSD